jgi:hypothetical protein
MIRKLNFTGRKKIPLRSAMVTLMNGDSHPHSFDIQLDLSELNLPDEALVYVEAYKRTSYMRFHYGTVGDLIVPASRDLTNIETGVIPLFRVKIVDKSAQHGQIIAMADKIHPKGTDAANNEKVSLLHVEFSEDLGSQVWRLDLEGDWPVLQVNNKIHSINDIAKSDKAFLALVYPEIVRQILNFIVESEQLDPEIDEDEWYGLWINFVSSLPGVGSPPTGRDPNIKIDQKDWLEKAVHGFCDRWHLLEQFQKMHAEELS